MCIRDEPASVSRRTVPLRVSFRGAHMTMTLDEVRKTRFHMSRRNGYEVTDVDIFVDKVEATLMTITEQNDHLRRQLEAAQTGGNNPELQAEADRLRAEVQRLRGSADEAASLQVEKERMQAELDQARAGAGDSGLVELGLHALL